MRGKCKGHNFSISGEMRRRGTTRMKLRAVVTGVAIVLVGIMAGVCVECKVKVCTWIQEIWRQDLKS